MGKDSPPELPLEFNNLGRTVGLMLCCLCSYFMLGKYVVLDSGFCILKGIIELKKRGVYACALIKKRRFWPTMVPDNEIDHHMKKSEVGTCKAMKGEMDGVHNKRENIE